jgi:hypothetical protein
LQIHTGQDGRCGQNLVDDRTAEGTLRILSRYMILEYQSRLTIVSYGGAFMHA